MNTQYANVWDPFIRIFHWSLVLCFFIAYVTEEDLLGLHVNAGYAILGLLLMRIVWGFVGPRYARFSDFVQRPAVIKQYVSDLMQGRAQHYLGHNPAGGLMIILLLLSLLLTSITGIVVYGVEEGAGPLAGLAMNNETGEEWGEELHEFFANFTLLLVFIHVAGVWFESIAHKENLTQAMFTGRKKV